MTKHRMTRDHTRKIDIETRLRRELIHETSDWVQLLKTNKLDGVFSLSTSTNAGDLPVLVSGRYDPIAELLAFSELLEPALPILAEELARLGYDPGPTSGTDFMSDMVPLMAQLGQSMATLDFKQVQILLAQHARNYLITRIHARLLKQQLNQLIERDSDHVLASKAETELIELVEMVCRLFKEPAFSMGQLHQYLIENYPLQALKAEPEA